MTIGPSDRLPATGINLCAGQSHLVPLDHKALILHFWFWKEQSYYKMFFHVNMTAPLTKGSTAVPLSSLSAPKEDMYSLLVSLQGKSLSNDPSLPRMRRDTSKPQHSTKSIKMTTKCLIKY